MFLVKTKKNNRGSVLAYALVILSITTIILVSMLGYISSQIKFSLNRVEKERAFQIAESGIYYYRWYLAHETSGKLPQEVDAFLQTGGPMGFSPAEVNYEGIGKYQITVEQPIAGSTILNVESTGWSNKFPDMKKTVKVRFRRPSWSEYAVLTNTFIKFGAVTLKGKVHSNGGVRIDNGTISNVASSAVDVYDDPDHDDIDYPEHTWHADLISEFAVHTHRDIPPGTGYSNYLRPNEAPPNTVPDRSDVFLAGRQFPVSTVSFIGVSSDLDVIRTEALGGVNGKYFDNSGFGRKIILKNDGTYDVCTVNEYSATTLNISTNGSNNYLETDGTGTCATCSGACRGNFTIPNGGVIFVEDNTWLSGIINNKKVSIVAANLTGIGDPADVIFGESGSNLMYTNFDGKDIIGVIAQRDVRFAQNSPNNLVIYAAMLAKDGRVHVGCYITPYKNSITINGALATNLRYALLAGCGTYSSGFNIRNLNFDNNLLYYPPPYFPTGNEYAIDLWEEL